MSGGQGVQSHINEGPEPLMRGTGGCGPISESPQVQARRVSFLCTVMEEEEGGEEEEEEEEEKEKAFNVRP